MQLVFYYAQFYVWLVGGRGGDYVGGCGSLHAYITCRVVLFFFPPFSFLFPFLSNNMQQQLQPSSSLQWVSNMDVNVVPCSGRKTSIIGTIGK